MSKRLKKIAAIVTTFALWFSVASPALAATIEELQAQIDALMATIAALNAQIAALSGGGTGVVTGCTITSFDVNLKQGISGDNVKCLQIVLNTDAATKVADTGAGSPGNETTYFGPLTKAAVIKFQEKYAASVLTPWGLTSGTGFVGSTTRTKLNELLGTGAGTGTGEVGTAATVSLASDTPAAAQVALNAQDVVFTKIRFSAGATAYTVTQIVISRGGVSADADISAIKLYDGATQLGSTQALNTTTHKATFTGLSWEIPAYGVKYLTVKASVAALGTATVGDSVQLGITTASGITATATPTGTFPIMGNARTIAGIQVGELFVAKRDTPATNTAMLSGSVDQEIACWRFTATSSEGFNVDSIRITHVGTAARTDVSNLKLKVNGVQIGSTVAALDNQNSATFDLSASPLGIIANQAKDVCAYADIASGIWTSRTIIFEITQYTDVVAYGANTGGAVTVSYNDTTAFYRQTGNTMTVGQGALTITLDAALNPASQSYVKGTMNRDIVAIKFSTASTEGVRVTKLRFTLTGTSAAATDISNITLWDGSTQIAGPASVIGSYVTFGANTIGWDTTGLFDVAASQTKTIVVKADIPLGATTNHGVILSLAAAGDVWADGLNSQYDLPSGSVSVSATGNEHTISGYGSLAVAKSTQSPPAQTYVKGSTGKVFTKVSLTAGAGEDITITSITVYCETSDHLSCSSGYISNAKILKSDGTQFGTTVASPIASASFSGSLTVPASQIETISLVADIPSTSNATSVHLDINTASSDMTSTGGASGVDISETGSATGNTMTVGAGSLDVSAAATPGDQTRIIGGSEVPFAAFIFKAGTGEDIRVTRVKLNSVTTSSGTTTDVSSIALYDGATRLTTQKSLTSSSTENHYVVFTASDFLNSQGITLTKGQQKTITVKANIIAGNTHTISFGIAHAANVTVVGLSSNTNPTPTITAASSNLTGANYVAGSSGHADLNLVTIAQQGILTIASNPDTPVTAIKSVSIEGIQVPGVAFHKSYFKATLEQIDIKSISVRRVEGRDDDFATVAIYEGDTLLADAQVLTNGSTTFSFVPDDGDGVWEKGEYWTIPTVGAKYLTIKATLNGVRTAVGYGSKTGDAPQLGIGNVTAEGVDSGRSPTGAGWKAIMGNAQIVRQGQPTIGLASPTSETYGAGTKELIRWTVSADAMSSIGWQKIVFDVSGGIVIGTTSYTIGSAPDSFPTSTVTRIDGIYMSTTTTSGGAVPTQLIATSSMQIWDVDTNTQVSATTTATDWTVDQNTATGTARVSFVPSAEQVVAAGSTKTYKLIASVLVDGVAGSSMLTQIVTRATTHATGTAYATTAASSTTFVWSDRSGASESNGHWSGSADWFTDFKVLGIPTAAKSLSK
jgi:hypothetical protein